MVKSNVKVKKETWKPDLTNIFSLGGLILCIIVFSIVPPQFGESIWTAAKLTTIMRNVIVVALMSVGAMFVYSMGDMDISIGRQMGLYVTLMVYFGNKTGSLIWGIVVSLVIAVVIAIVNGAAGEVLKIVPIVSSIVFMMLLTGVNSIIYSNLGTRSISLRTIDYSAFKNPWVQLIVLAVVTVIIGYLFNFTKLGKYTKAIGANRVAAQQSGVNIVRYKIIAYIIMGVCVVIASMFQMGYSGSASDATGIGYEMNVIIALILGDMPLSGGMRSKVSRAIIGAFTLSLLNVGLPLIGVLPAQTFLVKAIIFLVIVLITCRKSKGVLPR